MFTAMLKGRDGGPRERLKVLGGGQLWFPEKALRSKVVLRRRCNSARWVCLFPVAGAAAGSRPAYLTEYTQPSG